MELTKLYEKVRGIVRRCQRDYHVQLWDKGDWEQEGLITLHELLVSHPELAEDEERLRIYYKTKFRNRILDYVRRQSSYKRGFDSPYYEEVSEIGHRLSKDGLYLDDLVLLRLQLNEYKSQLSAEELEQYERLLADERFKGRKQMLDSLSEYLSDHDPFH